MRYSILLIFVVLTACNEHPLNIALGTLERERIAHTATVNEVVVALPVAQGSEVKKGTLLVKLDDTLQKAQVSKAEAEAAQAQANLEKLRNGARVEEVAAATAKVAQAKATLVQSEATYARSLNLFDQKLISKSVLDKDLATRDISVASIQNAREELLKLTNGTRSEDLRLATASLEGAIATLGSEKKKLEDLTILATRDGILDNLPWNLGERVTLGSPLAIVLAGDVS